MHVGEPLLRGYGAYQVEIMCSVPGNLALLPSFHFNRLESTSLTVLHLQAFLNILLLPSVALSPEPDRRCNPAVILIARYLIKVPMHLYFAFEETLAFQPNWNVHLFVSDVIAKSSLAVSNRWDYLTCTHIQSVKGRRLMFITWQDNEA